MSKWKPGQLVNLNGKTYRIHKTQYKTRYFTCSFCQLCNMKMPCIEAADYPNNKTTFNVVKCREKMPDGCIPKRI